MSKLRYPILPYPKNGEVVNTVDTNVPEILGTTQLSLF